MNILHVYPFPAVGNPDNYWRVVAALINVHDGDTYEFLLDNGFQAYARVSIRVRDLYQAELSEDEGPIAQQEAFNILVRGSLITVRGYRTAGGQDKKSFNRWIGDVYIDGQDIREMLARKLPRNIIMKMSPDVRRMA